MNKDLITKIVAGFVSLTMLFSTITIIIYFLTGGIR